VIPNDRSRHGALHATRVMDTRALNVVDYRANGGVLIVDGAMPYLLNPTERSFAGYGLIRHMCRGLPVMAGKIKVQAVQQRIHDFYEPYHAALKKLLQQAFNDHGAVWHVNCHSMPSSAVRHNKNLDKSPVDFVLGDRDGAASELPFIQKIATLLRARGFRVAYNDPYKGVEILHRYGKPASHVHSVQLEINRALYMNEETLERLPYFDILQNHLSEVTAELAQWTKKRAQESDMPMAAE
jgi:N-formylglutamate amidohydrolase